MANPMHITGIVSAQAARVDDAGLLAPQNAGLDVRTGIAWGPGTQTLVTGNGDTAPMSVWVGTCNWFTSRGVANGPYRGAAESIRTVTLAAAPASGSRIDVVYVKALDNTAGVPSPDGSAGESYAAVTGTPSTGTPVKPPLPVGAEELATVQVSAGAASTNDSHVTITNTAKLTVARGARIPVRSQADRDALTAFKGLEVYRLDTGQVQLCTGTGPTTWATTYDPAAGPTYKAGGGNVTSDGSGYFTIAHNLGVVPSAVFVQPRNQNANGGAVYSVNSVTSTTASVRMYYNNAPSLNNTLSIYWQVVA